MKLIFLSLAAVALVGCKMTQLNMTLPDGTKVSGKDTRFLVNTTFGLDVTPTTNGLKISTSVNSKVDTALVKAIVEGAVAGAGAAK